MITHGDEDHQAPDEERNDEHRKRDDATEERNEHHKSDDATEEQEQPGHRKAEQEAPGEERDDEHTQRGDVHEAVEQLGTLGTTKPNTKRPTRARSEHHGREEAQRSLSTAKPNRKRSPKSAMTSTTSAKVPTRSRCRLSTAKSYNPHPTAASPKPSAQSVWSVKHPCPGCHRRSRSC